jgi:DNA-directed RNA polymerase subunit RPC12/RpoP
MRIQFTDNGDTYTIETIKSFAKYLAGKISDGIAKPGKTKFIADFALTSYDEDDNITIPEILSDIRESGWYGVKELGEIGFNSGNRQFAFDYYGGQHLRIYDFDECFMGKDDAEWKINEILTDIFDVSKDNYLLLVQWNEDKCLVEDREEAEHRNQIQQYEVVEVCPECGEENIITWDVEKDGYVAYCPHCGSKMMLCDECLHADDAKVCDWCACRGCYRERENKKN